MHSSLLSSRGLLAASALALAGAAAAQSPPRAHSDAELLEGAKGAYRGQLLATARADLPAGDAALLVAYRPAGKTAPSFVVAVVGPVDGGALALLARDEIDGAGAAGAPSVALSAGRHPVTGGTFTAVVGWPLSDGGVEEQVILYRAGDRKLMRLLALPPARRHPPGSGKPSVLQEIELLPTRTGGHQDLRVRTRTVQCASERDCQESSEVASYTFDGVRYAERPFAIPFVDGIAASSELAERGGLVDHTASAAVDGRLDTAWCEGAKGAGWFEKLELTFVPAQRLKAIRLVPGHGTGDEFRERSRPKRIRVLLPDGRKVEADLADEPTAQRIALPPGERVFGMTAVIVDVYKGKREDACITELDLEVEP